MPGTECHMPAKRPAVRRAKPIEKPSNVNAIAVMTLVSGIVNLVGSLGVTFSFALTLFGLICVPITLLPALLGIFEILYAVKLMANPPQAVKPGRTLAIFEIVTFLYLNIISGVIGILALTMYTDPEVEAYFEAVSK
jgi:hypothetical protein